MKLWIFDKVNFFHSMILLAFVFQNWLVKHVNLLFCTKIKMKKKLIKKRKKKNVNLNDTDLNDILKKCFNILFFK